MPIENHPEYSEKKIIVVSQTTFSVKEWQESIKIIKIGEYYIYSTSSSILLRVVSLGLASG